ncbi:MAG: TonB-dependent receptor [Lysobacteraceae bacterium]
MTSPLYAQQTSSGLSGRITDAEGAPLAGAEVIIVHAPSGTTSRAVTDAEGRYIARGLRVGGPYTVTITRDGFKGESSESVYLALGGVTAFDADLDSAASSLEAIEVVAVGGTSVFSSENKGVGTSVGGRQMQLTPSGSRSLDDVARLDPRISVIDAAGGAISVAGVNNRFNEISVDGLSQGDPFGLNSNGMPYVGSPISVDTIEAYDIKITDFDVSTDVVGARINAVTKSGGNEFHGSVYYALKDADWVGKHQATDAEYAAFGTDKTYGFTVGGPILKDRLFFFANYEQQTITDFGGTGTADGVDTGRITLEEVNRAIAIAQSLGMQPGTYGEAFANDLETKRYLLKLDWNINDYHRASLTHQRTEEFRISPYDTGTSAVTLSSHYYNIDNITKNTSLQLFSDWSDNFNTEFKVSKQTFDQINGNDVDNTEVIITLPNNGRIFIGEDDNRHENQINTDKTTASFIGNYYLGNHEIKGGVEYIKNDVFNLYGKTLHGEWQFNGLDNFENGVFANYVIRRPAAGFTEADTAAALVYSQISPFIQDTWQVTNNLSLTYGVRVNVPSANKAPFRTPGFEEYFGFPNDYKLGSSNKVIMPRVAFNYQFETERFSQLRGGVGVFQSIPPFVWLANPYQNNGVNALRYTTRNNSAVEFSSDPYNQPLPAGVGTAATMQVDAIDPDFKLPTVYKISLGYDAELPWWGLIGTVEYQNIQNKDGIFYKALNIGEAQGSMFDGRANFRCSFGNGIFGNVFAQMNHSSNNCGNNDTFDRTSTMLSNTSKGASQALTFALNKPLSDNWFASLSYTFTHAKEVASDGSSQAWSSYQFVSRINPNQEFTTTAGRQVRDSIKATIGWEKAFFGDYKTSIAAYYNGHSGLPYTWLIDGDLNGDGVDQDPAYVPLRDDPNVSYGNATAEQIEAFHAFIDSNPHLSAYRGQIVGRNGDRYPWVNQVDLGIQQELPGFFKGHKSVLRLDIYNVLNMIDKSWGETWGGTRSDNSRDLANLAGIHADGTYQYDLGNFNNGSNSNTDRLFIYDASNTFPSRPVSRWSVMATLRYEF